MSVKFDTSDYFRSHGKAPKGTGQWAFRPAADKAWVFSPCMTYTQAKSWAVAQFPGATYVEVGA